MKLKNRTLLLIAFSLLALLSLPSSFVDSLRGKAVSSFSSIWQSLLDIKLFAESPLEHAADDVQTKDQEIKRLLLENQLLGNELAHLKELVDNEHEITHHLTEDPFLRPLTKELLSQHQKEVLAQFHLQLIHIPARVIFRPINAWDSSLWIDKGEQDNKELNRIVIAKNSPVVIGTTVVGVVDFVGEKQSRVRLITDSNLNLSVRIKRGKWLLAKGELIGKAEPSARSHRTLLKGVGFNYDFADKEGPARDLRTGEPLEKGTPFPALPLVQVNDTLITTGMDGVFPPNLVVGLVKKIIPLKEGDYAYDLEAESPLKDLNSLMLVFVLPPI
jgi:rod shape-determining protein MreC